MNREKILKIFSFILDKGEDSYFIRLCNEFCKEDVLKENIRFITYLLRLSHAEINNKKVLDIGCKFGLKSLIILSLGAKEVCGIDCEENYIRVFKNWISSLGAETPALFPQIGDAMNSPYKDQSFDIIFCIEAISHINNWRAFIQEAHRVLKNKGKLLIADGNNGLNLWVKRKTFRIWNAFENGAKMLVYGHSVKHSYKSLRKEIIRKEFPFLKNNEVDELAKRTSGMQKEEILNLSQKYIENGALPTNFYKFGTCPIHPISGIRPEFLFQPFKLKKEIESAGFKSKVYFSAFRYPFLSLIPWPFKYFLGYFYPSFKIVAEKI